MAFIRDETSAVLNAPEPGRPPNCEHDESETLRIATMSNGVSRFVYQCDECGHLRNIAGRSLSDIVKARAKPVKPEIQQRYQDKRDVIWAAYNEARRSREKAIWMVGYTAHLESEAWDVTRRKIFKRAAGLCEGCGDRPPTQVHHLTYHHLGAELLFELAALCDDCHRRAHQKGKEA